MGAEAFAWRTSPELPWLLPTQALGGLQGGTEAWRRTGLLEPREHRGRPRQGEHQPSLPTAHSSVS